MKYGGERQTSGFVPNWRERLVCPFCQLNNRQRLVATVMKQRLEKYYTRTATIYLMEQVTAFYRWAESQLTYHKLIGSEYMFDERSGKPIDNLIGPDRSEKIRHEDVMNLSFEDESFDLIVSNDVFEHVPDPKLAFAECSRILRPGGTLLATFPFSVTKHESLTRATLNQGKIKHILNPIFHGNPISSEGSLVFTDFGWDCLDMFLKVGFEDAKIALYGSDLYKHFGVPVSIFIATKKSLKNS